MNAHIDFDEFDIFGMLNQLERDLTYIWCKAYDLASSSDPLEAVDEIVKLEDGIAEGGEIIHRLAEPLLDDSELISDRMTGRFMKCISLPKAARKKFSTADIAERSGVSKRTVQRYLHDGRVNPDCLANVYRVRTAIDKLCDENGIERDASDLAPAQVQHMQVEYIAAASLRAAINILDARALVELDAAAWQIYENEHPLAAYASMPPLIEPYIENIPLVNALTGEDDGTVLRMPTTPPWQEMTDEERAVYEQTWDTLAQPAVAYSDRRLVAAYLHQETIEATAERPSSANEPSWAKSWQTVEQYYEKDDDAIRLLYFEGWLNSWPPSRYDDPDYHMLAAQVELGKRREWTPTNFE